MRRPDQPPQVSSVLDVISCALSWVGGRTHGELKTAASQCHSTAASLGLGLGIASVVALLGWSLWLLEGRQPFTVVLALVPTVLSAALFRQLAHASEAAAVAAQRMAIHLIAALTLLPGAWISASAVPPLPMQAGIEAHAQAVAARALAESEDAARRLGRIDVLRTRVATLRSEADAVQRANLSRRRAMDHARFTADQCQSELRFLRLSMPEPWDSKHALEHQAHVAQCDQLTRAAEQRIGRIDQSVARKPMVAKAAADTALHELEQAEQIHLTADRALAHQSMS